MPNATDHILLLNADDYAIAPGVSRGIRLLAERRRISSTSCMVGFPDFAAEAEALKPFADRIDIGLHLTLTDFKPLGEMPMFAPRKQFPTFPKLLRSSVLRRLPLIEIREEIDRQISRFQEVFKFLPTHIDGHHHVHQLPGIRDSLTQAMASHFMQSNEVLIRNCWDSPFSIVRRGVTPCKALGVAILGVGGQRYFQNQQSASLRMNKGFAGVYDFHRDRSFHETFARFLSVPRPHLLVMCHPGFADEKLGQRDCVTDVREQELAFFLGDQFKECLSTLGWRIGYQRELPMLL